MSRDLHMQLRGLVSRAAVAATDDAGESQTADVQIRYGDDRSGVEVLQGFGFASRPPAGAVMIVLAVGGDQGDLVALPAGAPGARLGGLEEGDSAIYAADGSRVVIRANGNIDVLGQSKVTAKVGDATVEMTADVVRGTVGDAKFAAGSGSAKIKAGGNHVVVSAAGIVSSVPIVTGGDPTPDV